MQAQSLKHFFSLHRIHHEPKPIEASVTTSVNHFAKGAKVAPKVPAYTASMGEPQQPTTKHPNTVMKVLKPLAPVTAASFI